MSETCINMPPLTLMSDFNNDWKTYMNHLYQIYLNNFFNGEVRYNNNKIKTFTNLNYEGHQQSFEHITTKGSKDRLYNEARCERLQWIKPILEGACRDCGDILTWKERDRGKLNIVIWCKSTDYVIILEQRGNDYYLISAYKVIYSNKRSDLEKHYQEYIQKNQNRLSH